MARRRKRRKKGCDGEVFKMKTKRGVRCACATTDSEGDFRAHFVATDACPTGGRAVTYKQARKKFG